VSTPASAPLSLHDALPISSGPGMALKTEALGLAVMTEIPLVICDIQRGGPSTGLPTKTEQADLLQALFGRNSEAPIPVLAAATPGDCFWMALEASRIALKYMVPVIVLSDRYLANGAEPWRIPNVLPEGDPTGDLLVVSWGSTAGSITAAVKAARARGSKIGHLHLRYLNPLPTNVGEILKRYRKVLVPELNIGQLLWVLRAKYLVDAVGLNKIQGRPFKQAELEQKFDEMLGIPGNHR